MKFSWVFFVFLLLHSNINAKLMKQCNGKVSDYPHFPPLRKGIVSDNHGVVFVHIGCPKKKLFHESEEKMHKK